MSTPAPEDGVPTTPPVPDNGSQDDNTLLQPPTPLTDPALLGTNSPRDSFTPSAALSAAPSAAPLIPESEKGGKSLEANEPDQPERRKSIFRRPLFWLAVVAAIIVVVLAVILPVYFKVIKTNTNTSTNENPNQSNTPTPTANPETPNPPKGLTTGGDGSTVTMENGTQFTYRNPFGGFWVWDPENPYNDNAQPQSWTPPLNQTWKWGTDKLYGVNVGGWFVLEPFISPALYQRYADAGAVDEWTISTLMAADTANGGFNQLEQHYDTFISEEDFAQMAGAGLNWIRLPIPWWAIDVWPGEPFLERTSWKYILRAFQWARKYGIRVSVDLHCAPGSQNAYNHSGRKNAINFLSGTMGYANAQRMLNYIRIFTEFFAQPEYVNVIPMMGILNEPVLSPITMDTLVSFNLEAYNMIREITGIGEGKGPFIQLTIGIGPSLATWAGVFPNADRLAIDTHPYFAFNEQPNTQPINVPAPDGQMGGVWPGMACSAWKPGMVTSQTAFGVSTGGEYSNGFNDCGFYMRSVEPYTPNNPDCDFWDSWEHWDQDTKDGLLNYALASMDALENPFFWTWKIGPLQNGSIRAPLWSYKLGLDNGWMPADPRRSEGKCAALGVTTEFSGTYLPWQTGGEGAGSIPATLTASYPWPPATISGGGVPAALPQYTPTGSISTLPPPTYTATRIDGWYDSSDTAPAPTPIAGCTYPDAWATDGGGAGPFPGCSPGA